MRGRAAVASAFAAALLGATLVAPALASADSAAVTVGDAAEAWYRTGMLGTCSSPIGCPPVQPPSTGSSYPADTLHIGVMAGRTTAVTYVQPDLSGLPAGDTATGGTMTLPLATMANNGNQNPSSATIEACLATGPFTDASQGSTDKPPPTDCSVHSAVTTGTKVFTLDLGPFLAAWNSGRATYGIALVPDPAGTGPTSSWRVSFNGRNLAGGAHITSALTVSTPVGATPAASAPSAPSPPIAGTNGGPAPSSAPASPSAAPAEAAAPSITPAAAVPSVVPALGAAPPVLAGPKGGAPIPGPVPSVRPATTRMVASAGSRGFQYPEVMLLPLAFAAGLVFVARALTSDATPRRRSA